MDQLITTGNGGGMADGALRKLKWQDIRIPTLIGLKPVEDGSYRGNFIHSDGRHAGGFVCTRSDTQIIYEYVSPSGTARLVRELPGDTHLLETGTGEIAVFDLFRDGRYRPHDARAEEIITDHLPTLKTLFFGYTVIEDALSNPDHKWLNLTKTHEEAPGAEEFMALRAGEGWTNVSLEETEKSLENSLFHVHLRYQGECVAMGRIVGDGHMYFYLQDIIVRTDFRGYGYGRIIMDILLDYLGGNAPPGAFVGLFSVKGVESFYARYGFVQRPHDRYGAGMFMMWESAE